MSDGSKIEWLHTGGKKPSTWNPTTGCTKISEGCKHCYAKREWIRLSANPKSIYYGRRFEDVGMHAERLVVPMLQRAPRRIFLDSMSDLFHHYITDDFIDQVFAVSALTRHHTIIALTKRADRMRAYFSAPDRAERIGFAQMVASEKFDHRHDALAYSGPTHMRLPIPNVQLGVSVESREYLNRVDELRRTPAAVRVISAEPLLEDLGHVDLTGIHQVYAGGETGPKSRPSAPAWFRSLRNECREQGVAFFFKQWGDWAPPDYVPQEKWKLPHDYVAGEYMMRVGKKNAGRVLDGVEHSELVA